MLVDGKKVVPPGPRMVCLKREMKAVRHSLAAGSKVAFSERQRRRKVEVAFMSRNCLLVCCVCLLTGLAWVGATQPPDEGKEIKAVTKHQVDIRGEGGKVLL